MEKSDQQPDWKASWRMNIRNTTSCQYPQATRYVTPSWIKWGLSQDRADALAACQQEQRQSSHVKYRVIALVVPLPEKCPA